MATKFKQPQYILIESESCLVPVWELIAKDKGIILATFNSILDFRKVKNKFNKDIPIYINYQHGELNGVAYAKELYDYGFTNIYLETGFTRKDIEEKEKDISWLKGIVGKLPPFYDDPKDR